MGRRWDRYIGTRYPDRAVAPLPTLEVRAALLALNGPGLPFVVRNGTPKEKADLVAECRIPQLGVTLKTRMRLVAADREVRTVDERWEVGSSHSDHSGTQYSRGPASSVYRTWKIERGADGSRRKVETFRFDTRDMKDPLRNTVLAAGWTWRGVLFKF
ncbi:hypothetical protein [Streptomyces sp. NPDC002054]|uniref:hypothetical protein n=1 Tax=Streptomyces sp. NPDC002054 TaxID=3154663 RepID=UPI00332C7D4A